MRTRRASYPPAAAAAPGAGAAESLARIHNKRHRVETIDKPCKAPRVSGCRSNCFDLLPDDLLVNIAIALASSACSPSDLVNMMLISRRFFVAATHTQVLASASPQAFGVKAESWSPGAHRFLKQCADAGNVEASYTLGMIRFYCLNNYTGASLMAKAAMASHAGALHSLAVIQFNGSGLTRKDKDLKAGVALCARAATLGHVDAIRELGHCLQDGYGVVKNVSEGRRLLLEANAREAAAAVASSPRSFMELALKRSSSNSSSGNNNNSNSGSTGCASCPHHRFFSLPASTKADIFQKAVLDNAGIVIGAVERHPVFKLLQSGGCSLLSDFGCNVPPAKVHVANKFLVDWFALHPPAAGLRLCSHPNCGRPETRKHEFRRCSACGSANYCSRACQALDWKLKHKYDCIPVADWEEREENEPDENEGDDAEGDEVDENRGGDS